MPLQRASAQSSNIEAAYAFMKRQYERRDVASGKTFAATRDDDAGSGATSHHDSSNITPVARCAECRVMTRVTRQVYMADGAAMMRAVMRRRQRAYRRQRIMIRLMNTPR